MEPALPEETVTKNDVQKASSERVGPMDDVLDSEVVVKGKIGICTRLESSAYS